MVTIKKTGEGYYLATLAGNKTELGRNECHLIKRELSPIIKPHREITLDIKGVKSIDTGGYKILREFNTLVVSRRCRFRFINIDPTLTHKISGLNGRRVPEQSEFDLI
jgi:anti-anti-sigma regulatory factor